MKRFHKVLALISFFFIAFISDSSAQIYIRVVPRPPIYVRPPCPHPGHIWIDGQWYYNGHHYKWRNGYWAAPRYHHHWIPGHWKMTRRGHHWIPGHWRRH